ncbi:unnamed protein product [Durusdinium trenchii]|uniref:Uncharacterized protein n=1 Tax=Durusdinium trenchii TaxID=1381693 RepID=A0ABP0RUI2_9DINO
MGMRRTSTSASIGLDFRRPRITSKSLALGRWDLETFEVVSQHAASTKDLAHRMYALCLRQLRSSRLSAAEQEDGTRSTDAQAAKAVVPAPSCGLLFTAVPHSAPREATLDAEEAQEAAAKAKKEAEAVLPPSLYSSPLYLDLDAEDPEARLARPLQELENHLTSIRTIAMALVPPEPDVPASEAPQLQVVSAPVSPLASVAGQSPAPSSAPEVLAKAPQARDSTGPRSAPWRRGIPTRATWRSSRRCLPPPPCTPPTCIASKKPWRLPAP